MRYLDTESQKVFAEFVNRPIWQDIKLCLDDRRPESLDVKDPTHVSAAKGHKRAGWDEMLAALEKLPFETDPTPPDPFDRPAVTITED